MKSKFRECLQKGNYRNRASILFALLTGSIILLIEYYLNPHSIINNNNSNDNAYLKSLSLILKSSAPIALLLSALAYNLRNKVFDFVIKKASESINKYELNRKHIQETLQNLTNLILISFTTSIVSLIIGHQPLECEYLIFLISFGIAALSFCCVQYIYALFAFEYLESMIIKDAFSRK